MSMKSESIISERGQVTLPKELRDRFGLAPGTKIAFVPSAQGIVIQKGSSDASSLKEAFGVIRDRVRTDDYLKKIRGKSE